MRRAVPTSGVVAFLAGGFAVATSAEAAVARRVNYSVTSRWSGGFTANVGITNLGDPVNGWRLTWSFPTGQSVAQAWNASVAQSGSAVTATNASYNGSVAPNGSVSFGHQLQWTDNSVDIYVNNIRENAPQCSEPCGRFFNQSGNYPVDGPRVLRQRPQLIFLHELGHTYGLDDFYDWDPTPGQGFIMKAGSASQITGFDRWMFRDWWRHPKSRYGH